MISFVPIANEHWKSIQTKGAIKIVARTLKNCLFEPPIRGTLVFLPARGFGFCVLQLEVSMSSTRLTMCWVICKRGKDMMRSASFRSQTCFSRFISTFAPRLEKERERDELVEGGSKIGSAAPRSRVTSNSFSQAAFGYIIDPPIFLYPKNWHQIQQLYGSFNHNSKQLGVSTPKTFPGGRPGYSKQQLQAPLRVKTAPTPGSKSCSGQKSFNELPPCCHVVKIV